MREEVKKGRPGGGEDFAGLMCDRKSSRRHGKRESSSRSSESGSRSADGGAPEVPIVVPDGKETAAQERSGGATEPSGLQWSRFSR